jgi:ubiquinone biosynthesis protein
VLVSEFIHAVLMADYIEVSRTDPARLQAWLEENNVEPRRLARRLINSLFRQLFEDNLYHGDMHPGNIVLLRDSRVALIDFGTTSFTEREYLTKFEMFARALATRDYSKAADLCFMLCAVLPHFDLAEVKDKVVRVIRAWATRTLVKQLPYHQKSIDNATTEIMQVLIGYRCVMDWAWLRIHRATSTLDASLIHLYPDVNYTKVVARYFRARDRRELTRLMGPPLVARSLLGLRKGLDIQDRVDEYTLFQGSLIRRHAQIFEIASNKVADVLGSFLVLAVVLLAVPILVGAVLAVQYYDPDAASGLLGGQLLEVLATLPRLDLQTWLLVVVIDLYLCIAVLRLRARLLRTDARPAHERVAGL